MRTKQNIAASLTRHGIHSVLVHAGLLLLMVLSYWLSQKPMADGDHRLVAHSPIDLVTFVERTEQTATEAVQALAATDVIPVREAAIVREITDAAQATEITETIEATEATPAKKIAEATQQTKAIKKRKVAEAATIVAKKIGTPSPETMGMSKDRFKKAHRASASTNQQTASPDHAHNPKPDYPVALRDRGLSGVVWLRVWVDAAGRPREIEVAKGSGYRLFDESALRAVQQWRFIPAKNEHQSLASWVEFAVRFVING